MALSHRLQFFLVLCLALLAAALRALTEEYASAAAMAGYLRAAFVRRQEEKRRPRELSTVASVCLFQGFCPARRARVRVCLQEMYPVFRGVSLLAAA